MVIMGGLGLIGVVGALVAMILQIEEHQHPHQPQQQEGHQNCKGKKEEFRANLGVFSADTHGCFWPKGYVRGRPQFTLVKPVPNVLQV